MLGYNALDSTIQATSNILQARSMIKSIVTDEDEYNRLINMVAAEANRYDSDTEVIILSMLKAILSKGVKSIIIRSVDIICLLHAAN